MHLKAGLSNEQTKLIDIQKPLKSLKFKIASLKMEFTAKGLRKTKDTEVSKTKD